MAAITYRPDLKTAGGEVTELLLDGTFVGAMTLVYREGRRLSGSIQLDSESLSAVSENLALRAAKDYVRQLADALQVRECEVIVTCSAYEHLLSSESGEEDPYGRYDPIRFHDDEDLEVTDIDPDEIDTMEMEMAVSRFGNMDWELVIIGETRNRVEYHLYDRDGDLLAESTVRLFGADAVGEIEWKVEPSDEAVEHLADLIVSDFNPDEVDTFVLNMKFDDRIVETIELTHEDLLDEHGWLADRELETDPVRPEPDRGSNYSVILVRDDGDTLTYDLYDQSQGGLPVGQATVDTSSCELTGFIDFRHPESPEDRELIGMLLMRELDKERECRSLNLTMLVNNKRIDEIWFGTETLH